MPKLVATTFVRSPMHIGRICAFCSGLLLLPSAIAAAPEPLLRRSEQLDTRRLGKISEDERSVLRIEWRVGLAGAEEAQDVRDMLDNLQRIEQTMAAVSVLVRSMPMQKPDAKPAETDSPPSDSFDTRLMVANLAAACLVALWWFRRRKPGKPVPTRAAAVDGTPIIATPPPAEALPLAAAESKMGAANPLASIPQPIVTQLHTEPLASAATIETGRIEPLSESDRSPAAAASMAPVLPEVAVTGRPLVNDPLAVPAAPTAVTIDFSLEEADPESVARENARQAALTPAAIPGPSRVEPETELEPTLQLAEIMLSMGLEQGAAQALVDYTEANPRHALYHWLKLLGIYRKRGLHKEFAETAEKLRQNFNIQAEDWAKPGTGETPTLEKFSRVSEHVQKIWSQPEQCIDYLRHLLEDNRDGARAGFPQSVAEEILLLVEVLKLRSGIDQTAGT
ncbi:MAG: hypothetical protein Q8J99_15840 [Sulfuritalea sp.]|nr:hypothetical protein [Sulfuritalea sp.]